MKKPLLTDLPTDELRRLLRWADETFGESTSTARAYRRALEQVERRERRDCPDRKAVRDAR